MVALNSAIQESEGWVEAVAAFIASPPQGIPQELLAQLAEAIEGSHSSLPPRVFYEAVQQSAVAISITDPKAKILYANTAFIQITGYQPEDVINKNESILSDKRTPNHIYKEMWQALTDKQAWSGDLINRRKNGERYIASLTIAPVLNGAGEITHYLGMHRDVTEKHRLSKEVSNQKKLIESVVDAAPVVIALLDESGTVVQTNQAYKKLKNQMGSQEPAAELWGALMENGNCKGLTDQEVRFDLGGGKEARWFSCSCTQFEENDTSADAFFDTRKQRYRLLVAKEITDIKYQQEAVRMNALKALMAEEELVQSVRETLAGAVYQLQGPLNMIAAASNLIDRKGKALSMDSLRRALRDAMSTGVDAMDTLRSCMPEAPQEAAASVNVNEILHEVLTLSTERLLSNGIIVDWKPTSVLPAINGREQGLRTMFKQLVDNAIDAMSVRSCKIRDLTVRTEQRVDDVITVIIDDTGPGIAEKDRINVFQPFFTTKGMKGKRAGMGLSMVQEIVSNHSGTITIGRAPEGGCRFELQLPLDTDFKHTNAAGGEL